MIDSRKRVVIHKHGKNGPYVSVSPARAEELETLLEKQRVRFFVDSTLSGGAVIFDLERGTDLLAIQTFLDSIE
jgi:hypothetical protein